MEEIIKYKLTSQEIYLLALKQILLNHSCLMSDAKNAKDSKLLADRIDEFLANKE